MTTSRHFLGITGPSSFTKNCLGTIEKFFGATPFYIVQNRRQDIRRCIDMCAGLIVAGGVDIHPRLYGYSLLNEYGFSKFDVERDFRELIAIEHAIKKKVPLFGICRGHQMIGIFQGLKMVPDLSRSVMCHNPNHQEIEYEQDQSCHWVKLTHDADATFHVTKDLDPDREAALSQLKHRYDNYLWTNSFHHQGLLVKGHEKTGVTVLGVAPGRSESEPIIEMMQGEGWLSVQWHPEFDWEHNAASNMVLGKFKQMIERKLARRTKRRTNDK